MGYRLGVDLGTTFTAAAVADGSTEPIVIGLGNRALQIPSVVFLKPEGDFLVGEAAERRGLTEPDRLAREFKRRIGDHVPIMVAGSPFSPQALTAHLLRWVVDRATERMGEPPGEVILTHPANWGPFRLELLDQVAVMAGVGPVQRCSEPEAAAAQYAAQTRVAPGDRVAVYDLGGGTFDACVLEKTESGFQALGTPEGVEHLGGVDFDEAVLRHVLGALGAGAAALDPEDPAVTVGLARLRRDCVEAKEALSTDVDTLVPVALPGLSTTVRITRAEFELMIRPALTETVAAMRRALLSARVEPPQLRSILLVGGSSRIPLVSEVLAREFTVPTALDTHPKHDVALGAARFSGRSAHPVTDIGPAENAGSGAVAAPTRPSDQDPSTTPDAQDVRADDALESTEPRTTKQEAPRPAPLSTTPDGRQADPVRSGVETNSGSRSSRRRQLLVLAAVLLVLVSIAGVVWYFPNRSTSGSDTPSAKSDSTGAEAPSVGPTSTTATKPTLKPSSSSSGSVVSLPKSDPLTDQQIVVPRGASSRRSQLFLADVGKPGDLRPLPTSVDGSSWAAGVSADRKTIVYIDGSTGVLRTMAADGTNGRALFKTRPRGCTQILHASWSPTEISTLVISCRMSAGMDVLMVVTVDGKIVRLLDTGSDRADDPAFSPDGTMVAYWAGPANGRDGGALFMIAVDGSSPPRQLTEGGLGVDADPAWSPDGDSVAFRRRVGAGSSANFDVLVMDLNDRKVRTLMAGGANDEKPAWSPDGDRLLVVSDRDDVGKASTTKDVWVVPAQGGKPLPLQLDAAHIATPTWSYH